MSYTRDRDEFISLATRHGLPLDDARALLRAATTLNRYAELACSSEAADRDRVRCPATDPQQRIKHSAKWLDAHPCVCDGDHDPGPRAVPRIAVLEAQLIRRLEQRIAAVEPGVNGAHWRIQTAGDPRGYVLRVIPPAYAVENRSRPEHDQRAIGVPSGPSGLKW